MLNRSNLSQNDTPNCSRYQQHKQKIHKNIIKIAFKQQTDQHILTTIHTEEVQIENMEKQSKPLKQQGDPTIVQETNHKQAVQTIVAEQSEVAHDSFKVKCGIFFGYNGECFLGMQYQRDHTNTIENIMHTVMIEGGLILKSNQNELKRIKWSRAARTDKKVHALCNGISVKLEIPKKFVKEQSTRQADFEKLIGFFNANLPMDIRVYSIKKVPKSFDMRHDALTRVYNYIIPLYIFQKYDDFKSGIVPSQEQQKYILEQLNKLCGAYLGTHNFHNFTKGYRREDPRCERYMISMKAEAVEQEVFERYWTLHKSQLQEKKRQRDPTKERYVRFTLVGQSFIYHQIRKMIGLLVKIFAHGLQGELTIKDAFQPQQFDSYLAPGEGLYLNRMTFEAYNRKKIRNGQPPVELDQQEEAKVIRFREYLESQILNHELEKNVFSDWLVKRLEAKPEQFNKEDNQEEVNDGDDNDSDNNDQEQSEQKEQDELRNEKKQNKNISSSQFRKNNREKFRKNRSAKKGK